MTRDRGEAFERFSRTVDGPLTILALVMIMLIVVPFIVELPQPSRARSWQSII